MTGMKAMPQIERDKKIRDVMSRVLKAEDGYEKFSSNDPSFVSKYEKYRDYSINMAKEYLLCTIMYHQDRIKKDARDSFSAFLQSVADRCSTGYSKAFWKRDVNAMIAIAHDALTERMKYVLDSPDILPGDESSELINQYIDSLRKEESNERSEKSPNS